MSDINNGSNNNSNSNSVKNGLIRLIAEHAVTQSTLSSNDAALFLMHVCLSRLSVIISLFAIAVVNGAITSSGEEVVLQLILDFARQLFT